MSDLFFKRDDLSKWTDGNMDLVRGFEQLVSTLQAIPATVQAALDAANAAQQSANGAYPIFGSNAAGSWVTLPDVERTTIQWGVDPIVRIATTGAGTIFYSPNIAYTFPIPFRGGTIPQLIPGVSPTVGFVTGVYSLLTAIGFTGNVVAYGSSGWGGNFSWFAIGPI